MVGAMTDRTEISRGQFEQLLRFYQQNGLDYALEVEPANRFARSEDQAERPPAEPAVSPPDDTKTTASEPVAASPQPSAAAPAMVPDGQAVALAEQSAGAAADLDALKAAVEAFEGCNLKRSARHTIFEGGRREAALMLIGAAPSRDDDKNGEAMSGIDGIMLGKMLTTIGLDLRTDVYCGFCVPWAVPGGEAPTALQLDICAPFLRRQIELAGPKLVVALGNVAARRLLGSTEPITRLHGRWTETEIGERRVPVSAMFGPSFLRDQPRFKRMAWLDLLALKERLASADRQP